MTTVIVDSPEPEPTPIVTAQPVVVVPVVEVDSCAPIHAATSERITAIETRLAAVEALAITTAVIEIMEPEPEPEPIVEPVLEPEPEPTPEPKEDEAPKSKKHKWWQPIGGNK